MYLVNEENDLFGFLTSFAIFAAYSSNSPLYFVPATRFATLSCITRLSFNISGYPETILWASPSAMAVFSHSGLAYQHRVVLCPARKYLDNSLYLFVPSYDRVKFLFLAIPVRSVPIWSRVGVLLCVRPSAL